MSSNRRPWYPWYPKDFITDEKVQSLSAHAEVVYRRALDVMWQANDQQLPSNSLKLANALSKGLSKNEFDNAWAEIQTEGFELFKTTKCGLWIYSDRLKKEAQKIENTSKLRSELGKKGVQAKAIAKANRLLKPGYSHTDTDTDTDIKETPLPPKGDETGKKYSESFETWWSVYPERKGKKAAYKSWQKIGKSKETTPKILIQAITEQVAARHFAGKNGNGDFIPHPTTWLNQGRWMDEIKSTTTYKPDIVTGNDLVKYEDE